MNQDQGTRHIGQLEYQYIKIDYEMRKIHCNNIAQICTAIWKTEVEFVGSKDEVCDAAVENYMKSCDRIDKWMNEKYLENMKEVRNKET